MLPQPSGTRSNTTNNTCKIAAIMAGKTSSSFHWRNPNSKSSSTTLINVVSHSCNTLNEAKYPMSTVNVTMSRLTPQPVIGSGRSFGLRSGTTLVITNNTLSAMRAHARRVGQNRGPNSAVARSMTYCVENKITTPPHNDTTTEMNSRIRVPRLCGSVPDGSPSAALVMSACNAFLSAMMSHLFGPTHPEQVRSTGRDVRLLAG